MDGGYYDPNLPPSSSSASSSATLGLINGTTAQATSFATGHAKSDAGASATSNRVVGIGIDDDDDENDVAFNKTDDDSVESIFDKGFRNSDDEEFLFELSADEDADLDDVSVTYDDDDDVQNDLGELGRAARETLAEALGNIKSVFEGLPHLGPRLECSPCTENHCQDSGKGNSRNDW